MSFVIEDGNFVYSKEKVSAGKRGKVNRIFILAECDQCQKECWVRLDHARRKIKRNHTRQVLGYEVYQHDYTCNTCAGMENIKKALDTKYGQGNYRVYSLVGG